MPDRNANALISLVVPFYNEGEGVETFRRAVVPVLESIPNIRFEIVCVDDGSCDDTLARLIALAERDEHFPRSSL